MCVLNAKWTSVFTKDHKTNSVSRALLLVSYHCQVHRPCKGLILRSSTGWLLWSAVIIWCLLTAFMFCLGWLKPEQKRGAKCSPWSPRAVTTFLTELAGSERQDSCSVHFWGSPPSSSMIPWLNFLVILWLILDMSSWKLVNRLLQNLSSNSHTIYKCKTRKTHCLIHVKSIQEFLLRSLSTLVAQGKKQAFGSAFSSLGMLLYHLGDYLAIL